MRILIIRPQPGADATAARVRAAGLEPVVLPLFVIERVSWQPPDASSFDAVLLTSGNAVRMNGPQLSNLGNMPIYAVGSATARASNEAGLPLFATGCSGVDELLRLAKSNGHRRLLWLAGEDRTKTRPPTGMTLDILTVYRSKAISAAHDFAKMVADIDTVLLHSVRAAHHFSDTCRMQAIDRARLTLGVLSRKIGLAAEEGWRAVIVAPRPADASLLSAVQRRFTSLPCDPYRNQG